MPDVNTHECVKWSLDGQLIGIAGSNKPVVAFDFRTGKLIYKGSGNCFLVSYFYYQYLNLDIASSLCFL